MSKIKDLLKKRSAAYVVHNKRILKALENNVIPAILEMLELSSNEFDKLEWTNVHLQDDHIVLSGIIRYNEGDVISDGDTTVTLDTTMALILDKMIRVGVPLKLAETGTKSEVYDHLFESQKQLREEYESVYGHEPPTMEEAMEEALHQQIGMDFGPDFNYNDLTEKQKEALFISMSGSKIGDKLN